MTAAASLLDLLREAQRRGFLGPGPVDEQLAHAHRVTDLIGEPPAAFLDLGSGGGLPGLVLAERWPDAHGVFLDASQRRCKWLAEAIDQAIWGSAPWTGRIEVRCGRAEELARDPGLREAFPLVTARSFGPPAVTAECAVGFLAPGGSLVVSEPPTDRGDTGARWPDESLRELGLGPAQERRASDVGVVVLTRDRALSDRWPRRIGIPGKRPLWKPAGPAADR